MPPERSNSLKRKKKSHRSEVEEEKKELEKVEDAAAILVGMSNAKLDEHQSSKLKEQFQEAMKRTQKETTVSPAKNVDMEGKRECSEELSLMRQIPKKKRGTDRDVSIPALPFDEADSVNFNDGNVTRSKKSMSSAKGGERFQTSQGLSGHMSSSHLDIDLNYPPPGDSS